MNKSTNLNSFSNFVMEKGASWADVVEQELEKFKKADIKKANKAKKPKKVKKTKNSKNSNPFASLN